MKVRLRPKVAASGRRHERPPRVALGLCLLLVGVCLWEGRHAAFEYDLRNLRAKHPETREFNLKVREVFPDARDPASILVPDSGTALRMADALEARRLAGEPGSPIEKVVSMHSLIPDAQDAKLRILASLREDLTDVLDILDAEERAEFAPLKQDLSVQKISGTQDLPAALRASFVGSDETPGELVYVYQAGSLLDLRVAQRFAKAVANLQVDGKTYLAVSEPLIYIDMIALLRHDTPIALALATLALFALLLIDFRSL